jgi:arabinose-5-phosphate isomerase
MSPDLHAFGRDILRQEADALRWLVDHLPGRFGEACERMRDCRGSVVVSGVGKAGLVGRKLSATLSSTGTRSFCLDPLNAFHGDLGMVGSGDLAILLSNGGASPEMLLIADYCRRQGIPVIALTRAEDTPLARAADIALPFGSFPEACPLRLAPSTSTTLMVALGDALALTVQHLKGFTEVDFARFHPAGSLGRQLRAVDELMRTGELVAVCTEDTPVFAAVTALTRARCGLCLITDADGRLAGVYSDGDFRRDGMAQKDLHEPVGSRCARPGRRIESGRLVGEALALMREARINALPVVDPEGRPLGLLDIQDLV